jgi:hypothetical protein
MIEHQPNSSLISIATEPVLNLVHLTTETRQPQSIKLHKKAKKMNERASDIVVDTAIHPMVGVSQFPYMPAMFDNSISINTQMPMP